MAGNPNFSKSVSFPHKMFGLSNFWLNISICYVNAMIFIQIYLVSFYEISCNEFVKGNTILSLICCQTFKFHMQYVMCDLWCLMLQTWHFVRSRIYVQIYYQYVKVLITHAFMLTSKWTLWFLKQYFTIVQATLIWKFWTWLLQHKG